MYLRKNIPPIELGEIAKYCHGTLVGDSSFKIEGVNSIDEATPSQITFFKGSSMQALKKAVFGSKAGAFLLSTEMRLLPKEINRNLIFVDDPLHSMVELVSVFHDSKEPGAGVSPRAEIHESAIISDGVSIGAFSVIGERVFIGKNSVIHPHVVIYPGTTIGEGCVIHSGAIIRENCIVESGCTIQNGVIIGSDGFGYYVSPSGFRPVPQIGTVKISTGVDVGANSCVDRATFGTTTVGGNTKIDNLVQIGHNVSIGSHSILCGQVGIAGSAKIGSNVTLGGNVGIADHVRIADNIRVVAKSGVTNDLTSPGDYGGYPATDIKRWKRQVVQTRLIGRKKSSST